MPGKKWEPEEDEILRQHYNDNPQLLKRKEISKQLPGRQPAACERRFRRLFPDYESTIIKSFTAEEDEEIVRLREREGLEWDDIAKQIGGHTAATFNSRYRKFLTSDSSPKAHRWTIDEDEQLKETHDKGQSWETIAKFFPGRTANSCYKRCERYVKPRTQQSAVESSQRPTDPGCDWSDSEDSSAGPSTTVAGSNQGRDQSPSPSPTTTTRNVSAGRSYYDAVRETFG